MKELFKSKLVVITLIKGFVFGVSLNNSNTEMIVLIGCIVFEFQLPKLFKKETKSPYDII
jgi:hypothetical protein